MLQYGNSLSRVLKNPSGQVLGFECVPNSQMVVKQDEQSGIISTVTTPVSGRSQRLNASEVYYFKCFTQDGTKGISPLYSLQVVVWD